MRLHVSSPVVSADIPACAKLGNLYGHSIYFPCISCDYQGVVCGCKPTKGNGEAPARWDNRSYRPASHEARTLLSGDPSRKLHRGEHIAFVDVEILLPHHLRPEPIHVAATKSISDTNKILDLINV